MDIVEAAGKKEVDQGSFTVILLAGDRAADPLAQISPGNRKALLSICGRSMLSYVLDTLMVAPCVGSVLVVANRVAEIAEQAEMRTWIASGNHLARIKFLEGAGSPAASVLKILGDLTLKGPVLVLTADSPLLSTQTLSRFCQCALELDGADVAVGLATERDIRSAFPTARRTFIRLKGIGYSGCNLFALMSKDASRAADIWRDVEGRRKRPWQLISYFGVLTLLRALLGQLDVYAAFGAVSRSMQLNVKPIILDDPLAAMDVNRPEHLPITEAVIKKRMNAAPLGIQ